MTDDNDNAARCVICARVLRDDNAGQTCPGCIDRVDRQLAEILERTALAAWYEPSGRDSVGSTGKPGSRPPIDIDALDAELGITSVTINGATQPLLVWLEDWERCWREHYDLSRYGVVSAARLAEHADSSTKVTLTGVIGFLRAWWPRVAQSGPAPEELAREVHACHGTLTRYVKDRDRSSATVIACPSPHPDDADKACGYRLRMDASVDAILAQVTCPRCSMPWTTARLLRAALAESDAQVWAPIDVVASSLGVDATTIRRWRTAGHVTSRGTLYDLAGAMRHAGRRSA
jgi:hypothetical protein